MKIGFSENFGNLKIFFKHFSINPIAKWIYGQNIENCATPPLTDYCNQKNQMKKEVDLNLYLINRYAVFIVTYISIERLYDL